ncbi:MAG: DNA primase [Deltaproteobacteria bacterium]|nr:DNA primase [Deltaproteobacteria bacterium]
MEPYQSAKEEIKRAVDIVELIGQFVQLRRAGLNYIGLCPFHSEKAPSFSVSPSKQMFHCFGCKKGGDLFAFWMNYHQVSFPQAMKDLADKYHISLPERHPFHSGLGQANALETLYKLNETAAQFYQRLLTRSDKGKTGRNYFEKRGIPAQIISSYRLGYAPDEWEGLTAFLKEKKVDLEKAVQAGLIIPRKGGGYYDRFRARVLFPIITMRQQVVGFGGRVLDQSLPKYINTPETPVFRKGELFYGLHDAHNAIREKGRAVIVEGYTDVLALRKYGFHEAVATLGTALSRDHLRRLKGYANETVLVFDADAAGKAAALRSLSIFLDEGMSCRVMVLPENEDPDSFVNKSGLKPFLESLDHAAPMFDFYLDLRMAGAEGRIERQVQVVQDMSPLLLGLRNHVQRALYIRRLSEKLGIAESWVLAELSKASRVSSTRERVDNRSDEGLVNFPSRTADDRLLLHLFVHYPQVIEQFAQRNLRVLLSDAAVLQIFDLMLDAFHKEGRLAPERILERLDGETAGDLLREAIMESSIYRRDEVDQALKEFEDKVHRLRIAKSKQKALGNVEEANKIPKLIKKRWG